MHLPSAGRRASPALSYAGAYPWLYVFTPNWKYSHISCHKTRNQTIKMVPLDTKIQLYYPKLLMGGYSLDCRNTLFELHWGLNWMLILDFAKYSQALHTGTYSYAYSGLFWILYFETGLMLKEFWPYLGLETYIYRHTHNQTKPHNRAF